MRDAFRLRTKYTLNTHVHTCIYGEKILSHHLPSLYVGLVYPIVMGVPRRPHALRSRAKDARQWVSYDATSNHPESVAGIRLGPDVEFQAPGSFMSWNPMWSKSQLCPPFGHCMERLRENQSADLFQESIINKRDPRFSWPDVSLHLSHLYSSMIISRVGF